ncbi:ketimine reductase mu-crystallin-like [Branchiostoma floridae x Branchiostoma japonicum]
MASASLPRMVSADDVSRALMYADLIPLIEKTLADFSRGDGTVVQPVRTTIPVEQHQGFFLVKPGYHVSGETMACKLLTLYPNNTDRPSHQACIVLFDPTNGSPLAVMDGGRITDMRTAAASAAATKHLAKDSPQVHAILGTGHQAYSHFHALNHLYKFDQVRVWGRTPANVQKFAAETGATACSTVEEAVKDADIITTVTMSRTPVLKKEWIKPGIHINAVGACVPDWQELDPELVLSSVVYVDTKEAAPKESGDIILSKAEVYGEVGEVILGKKEAFKDKTTIFKSLGISIEDVVTAKLVYDKLTSS